MEHGLHTRKAHYASAFTRMQALAIIAVTPPVVMPLEKMLLMTLGIWDRMSGTSSTLMPMAKLMASTSTALRSILL